MGTRESVSKLSSFPSPRLAGEAGSLGKQNWFITPRSQSPDWERKVE